MFRRAKLYFKSIKENAKNFYKINEIHKRITDDNKGVKMNIAQMQIHLNNQKDKIKDLSEVEFQVFSQSGEDGIIQYLVSKLNFEFKTFIEFGVENYIEANTRFLFLNNNWSGYIIDGSENNIKYAEHDVGSYGELYVKAAFINKENINDLLKIPGFNKEVGILSIDIDGNDYWVWKEINTLNPVVVIAEYNSVFGINTFWSIPYNKTFVRKKNDKSQLYYGASLLALCDLANQKGYTFVGCNSKGNNVFFIRNDKMTDFIDVKTPEQGYVLS